MDTSQTTRSEERQQVIRYIYTGQQTGDIPKDKITHLEVHPSVEEIPASAFEDCTSLVEVQCNEGLRTIGRCAFHRCSELRSILISSTVLRIESEAFARCESLVNVRIQEGLLFIGDQAFFLCTRLQSISLPSTLSMIGARAFDSCISLVEITFHDSFRSEGEESVHTSSLTIGGGAFLYCTSLKNVKLPEGLVSIRQDAFANCEELQSVSVPTTVETIGERAFEGCIMLYEIRFQEGLLRIEECAFMECAALRTVSFPSSLVIIGDAAFSGCESLVDVEFAEGLEHIGEEAFLECESLCAISLPRSVARIEEDAFICCTCLLGVEFPNGSNPELSASSFFKCTSLVNVSIAPAMTKVDDEAFSGCNLLQDENRANHDELFPNAIRDRFAQLPVHETCYNASIATVDELRITLDSCNTQESVSDAYGMTPFHTITTSAKLRSDFMEILLDRYPVEILACKDRHGRTMMDYLLMHKSTKAIPLIKVIIRHFLEGWTCGLVSDGQRRNELFMLVDSICGEGYSETRLHSFKEASKLFTSCMQLEITSIVEMALWKHKIARMEQEEPTGKADRAFCRYKCGADIVIQNVISFVWDSQSASCFAGLLPIASDDCPPP